MTKVFVCFPVVASLEMKATLATNTAAAGFFCPLQLAGPSRRMEEALLGEGWKFSSPHLDFGHHDFRMDWP